MNYFIVKILFLLTVSTSLSFGQESGEGQMKPCKDKPSCIISLKSLGKERNFLEPIKVHSSKENANQKIMGILNSNNKVKVLKASQDYIHATFTSSLFKFVDDVEFFFFKDGLIHFRSNSRTGHFDFGANKKRIENIRFLFHQSK